MARVSRIPTILSQRQKRRERDRSRDEEKESSEIASQIDRPSPGHIENVSPTALATLALEATAPASTTTSPAPGSVPLASPSRRRSFMQSITGSSSQTRDPSLHPPTRQGTGLRGRLTRNSTSSISGPRPSPLPDSLGLNHVYSPPASSGQPVGDIVFVHGLGGSAYETWSWGRDPVNFWPPWLNGDAVLAKCRILTFGYNSNFKGESTNLEILDFAKDLLMQMLTFADGVGSTRPVFFAAHSMGGLVVKKAVLLGMHDPKFTHTINNVAGIMFLATPHRGTQYAKTLSNILSTSTIGPGAKPYVSELERQSNIIQDINENFRQYAHAMNLVSFYETLKTSISLVKVILIDKESAILGYSNEMSVPLDADHHTICKFRSPLDSNFAKVKGILRRWVEQLSEPDRPGIYYTKNPVQPNAPPASTVRSMSPPNGNAKDSELGHHPGDWRKTIRTILGIFEHNELELGTIRASLSLGSGSWLYQRADYLDWLHRHESHPEPSYFWLLGLPGNGKTSLATCVISNLQERGECVQYHFFSESNQRKKAISYCLRSIALQLALIDEGFRNAIIALSEDTGISFSNHCQTYHIIWDKIFEGIMFQMRFPKPLTWVVDGIDEADSPNSLLTNLSRLKSVTPIRIFLTSRPSKGLSLFKDLHMKSYFLQESDTAQDIRNYTIAAVKMALPEDDFRQKSIVSEILKQASGNFLWVKLALDSLQECWHTEEDIRLILTEAPRGMVSMYRRMLDSIKGQGLRNQTLARRILTWAACSWRPLSISELEAALSAEFSGLVNLESTIAQICGNFITINRSNPLKPRVNLIHSTARAFLLGGDGEHVEAFVNAREGHQHIAVTCLNYLSNDQWKRIYAGMQVLVKRCSLNHGESEDRVRSGNLIRIGQDHVFLAYATSYWAYHVCKSPAHSAGLSETLNTFFNRYCLSWIEAIAMSGNLHSLVTTAQYLKVYAKRCDRKRRADTDTYEQEAADVDGIRWKTQHLILSFRRIEEDEEDAARLIAGWANDFIRLSAKFGPSLTRDPSSIYSQIPPFCPKQSMIWQTYGNPSRHSQLSRQPTFLISSSTSSSLAPRPSSQLRVTGLPCENWDDCLASVGVGCNDNYITKVLASETHFIGLVSSTGTVKIWNSYTCELYRTIEQGEYVRFMTLNRGGTLLATVGFQALCVWEVGSGRQLYRTNKSSNAMILTMAFGAKDSELVVGLDNGSIQWLDMADGTVSRTFVARVESNEYGYGCPVKMAISPDHRYVAMAWRGRPPMVWDLTAPSSPPIRYTPSDSSDSINAPEQLLWKPNTYSLLILCQNTSLVEWRICANTAANANPVVVVVSPHHDRRSQVHHPDEDDYEAEIAEFRHIQCWQMSVSADGKFLLTNDTSKTISIWTLPGLNLTYRLLNVDDLVSDLTFSPSGQRFFEVRRALCNVWEPDALVPTEAYEEDHTLATPSGCTTPLEPAIGHNHNGAGMGGRKGVVTALDLDESGRYFCTGSEDGSVQIHEASSGARLRKVYGHSASTAVLVINWSHSGKYIVSCDESARVVAKRLQAKEEDKWAVFAVFDFRLSEPVQQFVFNASETHLLVSTCSTDQVWDLKNKHLIHVRRWGEPQMRRWLQNPSDPNTLVWIDPWSVKQFLWPSLQPVSDDGIQPHHSRHNHCQSGHRHDDEHYHTSCLSPCSPSNSAGSLGISPSRNTWSRRQSCEVQRLKVTWVGSAADERCVVFATMPDDGRLWLSDMTLVALDLAPNGRGHRKRILRGLEERVKLLVGMYGNSLVFLDRDSWVCTWDSAAGSTLFEGEEVITDVRVTRHFFMPRDWLVSYPVPIPRINSQGTFFYPKYGDVAVVWNGVRV